MYTFEPKRDPAWKPYIGDPFDISLDPVRMTQMAAGALTFLRSDVRPAQETAARTYSRQQVLDSRRLPRSEQPYFTPGFPLALPLRHAVRIRSLDGAPTAAFKDEWRQPDRLRYEGIGLVRAGSKGRRGHGGDRPHSVPGWLLESQPQGSDAPLGRDHEQFCRDRAVFNGWAAAGSVRQDAAHCSLARDQHRPEMERSPYARRESGRVALTDRTGHRRRASARTPGSHGRQRRGTGWGGPGDR